MELYDKFLELYEYIAGSRDVKKMRTLGSVMQWMMQDLCKSHPELAQEYIESLESVKWDNYLTPKEAEKIVDKMKPQPCWTKAEWDRMMDQHGLVKSSGNHYNSCALYVTMCKVCSDSGNTLIDLLDVDLKSEKMFKAIHSLALDELEDEDKMYDVRRYFHMA